MDRQHRCRLAGLCAFIVAFFAFTWTVRLPGHVLIAVLHYIKRSPSLAED